MRKRFFSLWVIFNFIIGILIFSKVDVRAYVTDDYNYDEDGEQQGEGKWGYYRVCKIGENEYCISIGKPGLLLRYSGNSNVVIPNSITDPDDGTVVEITGIGAEAFPHQDIESLVIPSSVTFIDSGALSGWKYGIKRAEINANISLIPEGLFSSCEYLEEVKIPSTVTTILSNAFSDCNLKSVSLPSGLKSIGYGAFKGNKNLKKVIIPSKVTSLGDYAFAECTNLEHISLPAGLTNIGKGAFEECENLDGIVLSKKLKKISSYTFQDCTSMETIIIPEKVSSIGYSAFSGAYYLKTVKFKGRVSSIDDYAFSYCKSLKTIKINGNNLKKIGKDSFKNIYYKATIEIAAKNKTIYNKIVKKMKKNGNVPKQVRFKYKQGK